MFSVGYLLTQRMHALEIFNDSALYKCSLNNNNNNNAMSIYEPRTAVSMQSLNYSQGVDAVMNDVA